MLQIRRKIQIYVIFSANLNLMDVRHSYNGAYMCHQRWID